MYFYFALAVLGFIVFYGFRYGQWHRMRAGRRHAALTLLASAGMLAIYGYTQQDTIQLPFSKAPTLIAIAVDVSLSMATAPDPSMYPATGTRLARVQQALLPVITELDAAGAPVMIAVTAYTSKSEVILGWDDNLPQIKEALAYVLTPELLTEPGSNLGEGLQGAVPLFEVLPDSWQATDAEKYLIVVSDGEQTIDGGGVGGPAAHLRDLGVRLVALHVGSSDLPEGLPAYDEGGVFVGFEDVGGRIYSEPDPGPMHAIASNEPKQGLFVKAEDDDAVKRILDYIGVRQGVATSGPQRIALIVALWCMTVGFLLRYA